MHTNELTTLLTGQLMHAEGRFDDAAADVAALTPHMLDAIGRVVDGAVDEALNGEASRAAKFAKTNAGSKKVMKAFMKSGDETLMRLAAEHTTDPYHLSWLGARSEFPAVTATVAARTIVGQFDLRMLSNHASVDVRQAVAQNPNTEADVLTRLASDARQKVRIAVAGNPSTGVRTLGDLCRDARVDVRTATVLNPNTLYVNILAVDANHHDESGDAARTKLRANGLKTYRVQVAEGRAERRITAFEQSQSPAGNTAAQETMKHGDCA